VALSIQRTEGGGSADSVSICCALKRLLPLSDKMGLLSPGIQLKILPISCGYGIPAGVYL